MLNEQSAPRVLPTARELAEVHSPEALREFRGEAITLDDQEALALFEAAILESRRMRIAWALAYPAEHRATVERIKAQEADWRAMRLASGEQALVQGYVPTSLVSDERSASPSE